MKKIFASALLALGVLSQANATDYHSFGSTNVVFFTGSTAFRAVLYATITNTTASLTNASGTYVGLFDQGSTPVLKTSTGGAVDNTKSQYYAIGNLSGTPTILSVSLTGSEAGIASLNSLNPNQSISIAYSLTKAFQGYTNASANLPGTPTPSGTLGFPLPDGSLVTQVPDLAFADTSKSVSLSASSSTTDYGIVGVIPFIWVKGYNSTGLNASSRTSWTNLVNVTEPQLLSEISSAQKASFFTGNANDTDKVYLFGRNKGSGTRVNTLLDIYFGVNNAVNQYAVNCYYTTVAPVGVLTYGTNATAGWLPTTLATTLTSSAALVGIGNDGFDSGSGVLKCLALDTAGGSLVTLGYSGIADYKTGAGYGNYKALTLNGVSCTDSNVMAGTYPFWGHEHLYGQASAANATVTTVAQKLAGTTVATAVGTGFNNGAGAGVGGGSAFEAVMQQVDATIGGHSGVAGNISYAIDPLAMKADKGTGADVGYPAPL